MPVGIYNRRVFHLQTIALKKLLTVVQERGYKPTCPIRRVDEAPVRQLTVGEILKIPPTLKVLHQYASHTPENLTPNSEGL